MLSPEAWSKYNEMMDALIEQLPIQDDHAFVIKCNDCGFTGDAKFHPHGMKCGGCGGYNTGRN
jgi:hypothetical protein